MKTNVRKMIVTSLALLLLAAALAACSGGNGESGTETRVLRIGMLYGGADNEPYFRQQFTDSYELMHPEIEFEITSAIDYSTMRYSASGEQEEQPDPYEEMQKLLNGSNPVDVVVVDGAILRKLVQDNMLKELDPLIQQDDFDISDYVPTVIDGIKSLGDNRIFGLTPTFTSSALFYNKQIFQETGVQPPTDGMQWQDVINLAQQVAKGEGADRKFGLMLNRWGGDGFSDMQTFAAPLQLKMFDDNAEQMLVNNDEWKRIWTTVTDLYRNDISPTSEEIYNYDGMGDQPMGPYSGDMFLSGRVAMVVADYYFLNEIRNAQNQAQNSEDYTMIEWDVVTVPEHPEAPGVGGNINLSQLMGINAKAPNADDAWEFIKFLNGKEWAKLKSRSTYEMVAREEYLKPQAGMDYNIGAFTKMKPVLPTDSDMNELYMKYPYFYEAVYSPGQMLFQQVLSEEKSVDEALAEWETQGNQNLAQMKENPDQPLQNSDMATSGGAIMVR
ncbi:extracellular solute-binding protein [Paenibacillus sp. IB182496]|uniref:Extracellular solute-binding protein n=1 Tax=Paenibacillus sabuli TaxID=2772509 RepID=A0A927GT19_9BACL|nr:extracellular solute-binding protein [Paenibacillus sabuli]MBD2846257.1 extracellular solute-binding protein [Paenibacillus sabuli]